MDMVKFAKACPGIEFTPLKEEAPDGIEWLFAFLETELVESLDYRAIKEARPELGAAIF